MTETENNDKKEGEARPIFLIGAELQECNKPQDEAPPEIKKRVEVELEDRRIISYPEALLSEQPDMPEEERKKYNEKLAAENTKRLEKKLKLQTLYERELEYSKINRMKLEYDWKIICRIKSCDDTRKYLSLFMEIFERELDDKDAILQMLDRDIIEAEDHYNIALTNHFIHVKQLVALQDSRIKGLFREFENDVSELENEFNKEFNEIKKHFEVEQKELTRMFKNILEEYKRKFAEIDTEFQETNSNNQTKINEEYSRIQEAIRKAGADVHNKFASEMAEIKQKSEDENKKDAEGIQRLMTLDKEVAGYKKRYDKQQEDFKQWKTKIRQNNEDWDTKNNSIRIEKENIMRSYRTLKNKLIAFRNSQKEKLKKLVKNSFDCEAKLKNFIKLAEKILKLAEISRRLEIEKEKILPYYENSTKKKDTEEEENEIQKEDIKNMLVDIKGIDPVLYEEIESLQNFWKRFNKVKLDVIAIKKQKNEIEHNNEFLKNSLQLFYDGFHVNNVVMTNDNPLLIIRATDGDYTDKNIMEKDGIRTYQEVNNIVNDTSKQRRFAINA